MKIHHLLIIGTLVIMLGCGFGFFHGGAPAPGNALLTDSTGNLLTDVTGNLLTP